MPPWSVAGAPVIGANTVNGWRAFIFILFPDDMFTIVYSHVTSSW